MVAANERAVACDPVKAPHLVVPEDPYISTVCIEYRRDVVASYCAFSPVLVELIREGVLRFLLCAASTISRFSQAGLRTRYWSDGSSHGGAPRKRALEQTSLLQDLEPNMLR